MIGGTANLSIIISAIDRASGTFSKVGNNLSATGAKMKGIGKGMTMGLTLPIAALGVASVKTAMDFEDTAKKVGATANLNAEQVKKLSEGVEKNATATGQATDGIFAAMQKAVSGSLDLAQSQELVAKTTKAAAAGFGENERLVDVTTTAYDLFGKEAGSASAILDDIVRASQSTQVNVEGMAGAFSRGAPTAANLGMSQKELAAMLGVVSERMGDTQRGGRALAMMLREIQKPTGESKDIIEELYGSVDKFQEGVSEDAIGALKELKEKLKDTDYGIEDVVTSSNALDAANMLLADDCERVSDVLGDVEKSAGATDDAYDKSGSSARELAKAKEKLAAALRPLGTILMEMITPAITKLSEALKKASEWFNNLSPSMKKVIIVILGLLAAAGPLLMILGTILPALPVLKAAFLALCGTTGLVVLAIAAIATAGYLMWKNWDNIKWWIGEIWDDIKDIFSGALDFIKNLFLNWTVPGLIIKNWDNIVDGLKRAKNLIIDSFLNLIDWFKGLPDKIWNAIKGIPDKIKEAFKLPEINLPSISGASEKVGGFFSGVGEKLKFWEQGGVVPGIGPQLAVVHGGETIIPRGKGIGGVNIYIQGGNYLDREAGEKFAEVLGKMLRRELRY